MEEISTVPNFLDWVSIRIRENGPETLQLQGVVFAYLDMLSQLGEDGEWSFRGTRDEFLEKVGKRRSPVPVSEAVLQTVAVLFEASTHDEEQGGFGISIIRALPLLILATGLDCSGLALVGGIFENVRLVSDEVFAEAHGVMIDVVVVTLL